MGTRYIVTGGPTELPIQVNSADNENDQPPSNESSFRKIKATHDKPEKFNYAKELCASILTTAGLIVCSVISLCICFANITIGSIYVHDCTIERFIPIYLVVGGICALTHSGNRIKDRGQGVGETTLTELFSSCFNCLLSCFMFAWLIAGNVWIYSIYNKVNTSDSASPQFCNYTLYYYAFWYTILVDVTFSLTFCFGCSMCCVEQYYKITSEL